MQYGSTVLAAEPVNGVTCGIDWARDDHAAAIVDAGGREVHRSTIEHSSAGLRTLVELLTHAGVAEVAIERPDGPVVDALLGAGITVVVISPHQLKNLRSRYGSAGNKDDRFDAFVLADTLRTDRARLRPLVPDGQSTVALRGLCRARKDLVAHRVRVANQLREHLNRVFPGAVGLFTKLDSPISLRFLARFDCQDRADWLTPRRLESWLKSMGYCGRADPAAVYARLSAAPRGVCADAGAAQVPITRALVAALGSLVEQITMLSDQIGQQLEAHADSHIFTSLPHAGTVRAARLLAEIGDCRARFPTPESLACLAGVAPSTRQSGKMRSVGFRWACDKQLRDAVCDFADGSRRANPWAAQLYGRSRARGHDHPHAVRVLARAWVYIIWACWQANTAYDPGRHRALQALLKQPEQPAA
jgi:transposase